MLAFVHIEKTAGMSTHSIFQRSFGLRYAIVERWRFTDDSFSAADYRRLRWMYPRLLGIGGHWIKPYGDLGSAIPDLQYFTFIREPLARAASHFQHRLERMDPDSDLAEWLREHRNFQTRKLVGSEDAGKAIEMLERHFVQVGLADRFDESMLLLNSALGDTLRLEYRRENVSPDTGLKRRLLEDPKTRALLEDAHQADLEVYAWVCEQLYPRQRNTYGPSLEEDVRQFQAHNQPGPPGLRVRAAEAKRALLYRPAVRLHRILSRGSRPGGQGGGPIGP